MADLLADRVAAARAGDRLRDDLADDPGDQLFDLVYTTTRGGPLGATKTIVYFLWEKAFKTLEFGYGSAAAYVLFVVTLLITIGMVLYSRSRKMEAF